MPPPVRPAAEGAARRAATPANLLTALRLAAAPALALAIAAPAPRLALALFALAVATDLLDGPLARRRGEASPGGGLFDHGSDALCAALGLGALALRGEVPALLPPLVALAFLQYALDSRALAGRPLRASRLGRWNGVAYFVLLAAPLVRDALAWTTPSSALVQALGWVLLATTLISMVDRGLASWSAWRASRGETADPVRLGEVRGAGPDRRVARAASEDPST